MTATSKAREALAGLSPMTRETQQVLVIVAELLIEQNEHLEAQNDRLAELLKQGQGGDAATVINDEPARTPDEGAGRSADETPAPSAPAPPAANDIKQEEPVRLTEPERPPVDEPAPEPPVRPGRPAKKTTAPAKAAKTTSAGKPAGKAGNR